jgi:hypothetical protein
MADTGTPVPLARGQLRRISASLPHETRLELANAMFSLMTHADTVCKRAEDPGQPGKSFYYWAGYARAMSEICDLLGGSDLALLDT